MTGNAHAIGSLLATTSRTQTLTCQPVMSTTIPTHNQAQMKLKARPLRLQNDE